MFSKISAREALTRSNTQKHYTIQKHQLIKARRQTVIFCTLLNLFQMFVLSAQQFYSEDSVIILNNSVSEEYHNKKIVFKDKWN